MLLQHSSRSQNGIEIGSKNVKNASQLALGLRISSRIPVICGEFESARHVECAENYRMLLQQQNGIEIGSKNVKNALEWALGLGIGTRIPVICGFLESSGRYEFEKIFRILLPHSSRPQFTTVICSKNVKKLNFTKSTHLAYQNVRLGELIKTVCLFSSFDYIFGSLGAKKRKNSYESGQGVRIGSSMPVICCLFQSGWRIECAHTVR
jgi:hypothetical protein